MSLEISPEAARMVHGILASGAFASESEVITTAVQLLHDRQQLINKLDQGRKELDEGQRFTADVVFAELRARARELDGTGS